MTKISLSLDLMLHSTLHNLYKLEPFITAGLGLVFQKISLEYNKQLLDEVEHDIMNYQNRGLCYLPKRKAEY